MLSGQPSVLLYIIVKMLLLVHLLEDNLPNDTPLITSTLENDDVIYSSGTWPYVLDKTAGDKF